MLCIPIGKRKRTAIRAAGIILQKQKKNFLELNLILDLDDECGFLDLGVFAFIFLSCNLFILPLNYKADRQILED